VVIDRHSNNWVRRVECPLRLSEIMHDWTEKNSSFGLQNVIKCTIISLKSSQSGDYVITPCLVTAILFKGFQWQ